MSLVKLYKNGSYRVQVNTKTGSKYIFGDNPFIPEFPDSIDLKITDQCKWGCPFCYESSGSTGKHGSLEWIKSIFQELPCEPIEIAVGGGNPLLYPHLRDLIDFLKSRSHIVNITINYNDVPDVLSGKYDLTGVSGLGISVGLGKIIPEPIPGYQVVYHTIAGITPVKTIMGLLENGHRVLVLGYKNMGRATTEDLPNMKDLEISLKSYIHSEGKPGILVLDNLSSIQLNIKGALLEKDWTELWMGPEFSHSMFIDAVSESFHPSSTDRLSGVSAKDISLIKYFKENNVKDFNRI